MEDKQIYATDLTKQSVSILTIKNDKNYRIAYINSPSGRLQLHTECDAKTVAKVFETWGDTPTVEDYIPEVLPEPEPAQPTPDQLAILDLTEQIVDNDYRISVLELGL